MPIRPENASRYPVTWEAISTAIKDRAAWRCECEGECAAGARSKVVLTTAHLNHTPEDCSDGNLKAMCQGCHLHYDRHHHAQTAYRTRREGKVIKELWE